MSYYYDYTNISAIEHSIKLQQAKLKLAQLEGVEYRIEDCKKAINRAKYTPTKSHKALAVKLLKELTEAVANLEEVKPKPKAKKKSKTSKRKPRNQRLEESQAKQNVAENFIPEAVAEVNTLPEFSELRSMGYSVEDAVRYCKALMQGAPQTSSEVVPF